MEDGRMTLSMYGATEGCTVLVVPRLTIGGLPVDKMPSGKETCRMHQKGKCKGGGKGSACGRSHHCPSPPRPHHPQSRSTPAHMPLATAASYSALEVKPESMNDGVRPTLPRAAGGLGTD